MKIDIGIQTKSAQAVVTILNRVLSDEYLLYTKTLNYHWNVTGSHFNDLHKFFGEQYSELAEIVDDVAERVRSLDGKSHGTMTEFLKTARLKETPGKLPNAQGMISDLLSDHESVIRSLRVDLAECLNLHNDAGTSDFLTGLMERHEKTAWMLRAFLETK